MVAVASVYTLISSIAAYSLRLVGCNDNPEVSHSSHKLQNDAHNIEEPTAADIESEIRDITNDVAVKKELSAAAGKLEQSAKTNTESRKTLDGIVKEEDRIREEIGHVKLDRVKELNDRKRELLKKIASIGKTLRVEHDARFPHLAGQPIIIVAKDDDDTKRTANTLAHMEGLSDAMNKIRSPCSSLERIRSDTLQRAKKSNHDRFAVVQKTLDSMSLEERLHYDRNMIEHYEGIIRELEEGIAEADAEIDASWQLYRQ
ncbi:uncharacterized protein BXIN_1773 [Babesia sp. Xinjiang]|uniref:uncharacterized protein n=1 Tax=Babesia sp. Xinjiang TaxID=462227 RepID=UPI000A238D84|nr:uncharacterized protein BXIN_1646 [Babesia sp. Xinjiang]XP_028871468.1 uncharacterized protein BXIN_1773 [Babesia sp. Xinjiang]ORM40895.1 hypothetical protein BXIN_1646 [Babesia sp. Xinjiang]ORM41012.1 hypothetical protein BXIN_1773 [Babesia sp. Xinjiang]